MKLLDEIVDLLSNESGSINEALLKTKVLLHRIGQQELTGWVNDELNGYDAHAQVPAYRQVSAVVEGNLTNGFMQWSNHPLPVKHLSKEQIDHLQNHEMRQSLAVLQQYAGSKAGTLKQMIPLEYNGLLGKTLVDGVVIEVAWTRIAVAQIVQIVTEVRSRLLDFILNLQTKLGDDVPEAGLKEAVAKVDAKGMFANSVFGHGATIVLGANNTVTASTNIGRGDLEALSHFLRQHKVSEGDIDDLEAAISKDGETPELKQKKFGPAVNNWLKSMMTKAVDAAWNIELGIAGGLLANALQAYYFG